VEVLIEGKSRRPGPDGQPTFYGRSPQGKVTIIRESAKMNDLVQVRIDRVTSHTLYGKCEI
jgi:tRNA A37 methylthiotransferase MiaB